MASTRKVTKTKRARKNEKKVINRARKTRKRIRQEEGIWSTILGSIQ